MRNIKEQDWQSAWSCKITLAVNVVGKFRTLNFKPLKLKTNLKKRGMKQSWMSSTRRESRHGIGGGKWSNGNWCRGNKRRVLLCSGVKPKGLVENEEQRENHRNKVHFRRLLLCVLWGIGVHEDRDMRGLRNDAAWKVKRNTHTAQADTERDCELWSQCKLVWCFWIFKAWPCLFGFSKRINKRKGKRKVLHFLLSFLVFFFSTLYLDLLLFVFSVTVFHHNGEHRKV